MHSQILKNGLRLNSNQITHQSLHQSLYPSHAWVRPADSYEILGQSLGLGDSHPEPTDIQAIQEDEKIWDISSPLPKPGW